MIFKKFSNCGLLHNSNSAVSGRSAVAKITNKLDSDPKTIELANIT